MENYTEMKIIFSFLRTKLAYCIALLSLSILNANISIAQEDNDNIIRLDSVVRGNQEQPNVLYIVPWKKIEDDTLLNRELKSRLTGIYTHIDRSEYALKIKILNHINQRTDNTTNE